MSCGSTNWGTKLVSFFVEVKLFFSEWKKRDRDDLMQENKEKIWEPLFSVQKQR